MRFKNLHPQDLEGSTEVAHVEEWASSVSPEDAAVLIVAPAGSGKAAVVGRIARRLDRDVVECDLCQVLEYDDSDHQLDNILTAAEAHRNTVIYLRKLDRLIESAASNGHAGKLDPASHVSDWLGRAKERLRSNGTIVMATIHNVEPLTETLRDRFDRVLTTGA